MAKQSDNKGIYYAHIIYQDKLTGVPIKMVHALSVDGLDKTKHPGSAVVDNLLNKHPAHKSTIFERRMKVLHRIGSHQSSSEIADNMFKGEQTIFKAREQRKKVKAMKKESYTLVAAASTVLNETKNGGKGGPPKTLVEAASKILLKPANDDSPAKRSDDLYRSLASTVSNKVDGMKRIPPDKADVIIWHHEHKIEEEGAETPRSLAYMHYVDWVDNGKTTLPIGPDVFHNVLRSQGVEHSFDGKDVVYHNVKYKTSNDNSEDTLEEASFKTWIKRAAIAYAIKKGHDMYHDWQERKKSRLIDKSPQIAYDPQSKRFWGYYHDESGDRVHISMDEKKFHAHLLNRGADWIGKSHPQAEEDGMVDPVTKKVTPTSWAHGVHKEVQRIKTKGETDFANHIKLMSGDPNAIDKIKDHLRQAASAKYQRRKAAAGDIIDHPENPGNKVVAKQYYTEKIKHHQEEAKKLGWTGE